MGADDAGGPWLETFLLADRAEIVGGKLYVFGGFVDTFNVAQFPTVLSFGFALSVRVPERHVGRDVNIRVDFSSDANIAMATLQSTVVVPRPAVKWPDSNQRIAMAVPQLSLTVESEGIFFARALIDEEESASVPFRVQHIAR